MKLRLCCILLPAVSVISFLPPETPVYTGDPHYAEAISYINTTDSARRFIRKHLHRKALEFRVSEQLIKGRFEDFWRRAAASGITKPELQKADSLSENTYMLPELKKLSRISLSPYRFEFSRVSGRCLYAHLTSHNRITEYPDGSFAIGGGLYLVFLFVFDDTGKISAVYYGRLHTE